MSKENLLKIDLNELVSKQIAEKIDSLEKELATVRKSNRDLYNEKNALKAQVDNSKTALGLLDYLREEFAKIQQSVEDKQGYFESKQQNQFLFIERALLNIFNIKKEANGWYCSRGYGELAPHLAVNFYSNKQVVIDLLKILKPDCYKEVSFIQSFKMPFDYSKEEVIQYVKEPKYNTNNCIFGISHFWIESGAGKSNMPHDLIMRNPLIVEDDVFGILLDTIKKQTTNYHYLFALPKYSNNLSEEQVMMLGECLTKLITKVLNYDEINYFISANLKRFNNKTSDFLYNLIQSDNQFKPIHWEKFTNEYQMRFLKEKPLDEVLKLLTNYACTWTIEQKQSFLKEYTNP